MSLPEHQNPTPRNAARAPYNFVPLPDVVIKAVASAEALSDHDRYVDDRYTGHFEVTLTTKTPLYIRGMLTETEFIRQERKQYLDGEPIPEDSRNVDFRRLPKNKPDFFVVQENPLIPGSSLRGMLRNVIEIITYSKMQWVTDKQLFFRTMDDSIVGESYRQRMMGNVEAGFLRRHGETYTIHTTSYVRVHHDKLGGAYALFEGKAPNQTPKWNGKYHQHLPVWVTLTSSEKFVDEFSLTKQTGSDWHEGRLVITGNMPGKKDGSGGKKKEFVFLMPSQHSQEIDIPETMMERFHDDDQVTQWQQKAFPKDKPYNKSRGRNGLLMTNPSQLDEPVFFLREKGKLVFFGRAQMFRLPYQQRPMDLIPYDFRDPNDIDFAEAMFGFVRTQDELKQMNPQPKQGSKGRAYAGRVFVGDGCYQPNQGSPWMSDTPDGIIEPHILATPKPTSFQLYLTQDNPNDRKALYHYDSNADVGQQVTTLRGFKLYWPQGKKTADDLQAQPKDDQDRQRAFETVNGRLQPKSNSTQHTRMKPVASGKKFCFRVHFENLTDVELGALQWALSKPNCHRLGMGKPLGLGVVQLEKVELQVNGRSDRYRTLFENGTSWNAGQSEEKQDFTTGFETTFLRELRQHNVPVPSNFSDIERIKMLLTMLTWQEQAPQADRKEYMANLNEFRYRPVLPDPLNLGGSTRSSPDRPRGSRSSQPQHSPSTQQHIPTPSPRPSPKTTRQSTPTEPILREKTAVPTQFISQVQAGDILQGRILFVEGDMVYLEFPSLLNLTDKDVLGMVKANMFSDGPPNEGIEIACKVVEIIEDDTDFIITCELI